MIRLAELQKQRRDPGSVLPGDFHEQPMDVELRDLVEAGLRWARDYSRGGRSSMIYVCNWYDEGLDRADG